MAMRILAKLVVAAAVVATGACEVNNKRIRPDGGMLLSGGGLLSPGGGLLPPALAPSPVQIIVAWGQSNMKGQDYVANLTATWDFLDAPYGTVQYAADITWPADGVSDPTYTQDWVDLDAFTHDAGDFGPELSLGRNLGGSGTGTFRIIKSAHGGTSLADDWAWDTNDTKLLFDRSSARVTELLATAGETAQLAGLIWVQGVSDGDNQAYSLAYANNLITHIDRMRAAFGDDLPFVFSRLHSDHTGTYTANVQAAQDYVAANVNYVSLVAVDDLTFTANHFKDDDIAELGDRLGDAMATLIATSRPTTPPDAGPFTFGIGNNGSFESVYAHNQWTMQELSGQLYDTGSGTADNPVNMGGLKGQTTTGMGGRKAWVSDSTAANKDRLRMTSTATGDSANVDFAFRIVFKKTGTFATSDFFFGKWLGGVGWHLNTLSVGRLRMNVDDGATNPTLTLSSDYSDGNWHHIDVMYDQSAQILYMKTDLEAETSVSTAGVGSISNAGVLGVNSIGDFDGSGTADSEWEYVGVAVGGTDPQNLYDETVVMPS